MKILFITDEPTHPVNSGRRSRFYQLVETYKSLENVVVYMVWLRPLKEEPSTELIEYWGQNMFLIDSNNSLEWTEPNFFDRVLWKVNQFIDSSRNYNRSVDCLYDVKAAKELGLLVKEQQFDVVISEYIFTTKYLELFSDSVLKIVDTHDVFTNRYEIFLKAGQQIPLLSVDRNEELKALNRAQVVLAIQEDDKEFFESDLGYYGKVLTIGHNLDRKVIQDNKWTNTLLLLGTGTSWNIDAHDFFIHEVKPLLDDSDIVIKVLVAGSLCQSVKQVEGVQYLGFVEDLEKLYKKVDVVLNPTRLGTGLKIKSIEGLQYGKIVVGHSHAFKGLKDIEKSVLIADDRDSFAESVLLVCTDENLREKLKENSLKFISDYSQQVVSGLKSAIKI